MFKKIMVVLALGLLMPFQVGAEDKGLIELKSVSEVELTVQNDKGEPEVIRVDAAMANVAPGDTVIFSNHYANFGEQPAEKVVIVNAVPEHMLYVADTAEGEGSRVEFSIDKGNSYGVPEDLKVTGDNGKERVAGPGDYTHIRWVFAKSIAKGESGSVSFRARVK